MVFLFGKLFYWLNVQCDVGVGTEMLLQFFFYLTSAFVRSGERKGSVHADVKFNGVTATNTARAQVVRIVYVGKAADNVEYFFFHFLGQGGLQQFVESLMHQFPCYVEDEERDNQRSQRVEHCPAVAKQNVASDADECSDRGKCIAAVVPCVGFHSW